MTCDASCPLSCGGFSQIRGRCKNFCSQNSMCEGLSTDVLGLAVPDWELVLLLLLPPKASDFSSAASCTSPPSPHSPTQPSFAPPTTKASLTTLQPSLTCSTSSTMGEIIRDVQMSRLEDLQLQRELKELVLGTRYRSSSNRLIHLQQNTSPPHLPPATSTHMASPS
jgi:hypothetical protein